MKNYDTKNKKNKNNEASFVRAMTDEAIFFIYLFNIKGIIFGSKGRKMFQLLRIHRKMYKIK